MFKKVMKRLNKAYKSNVLIYKFVTLGVFLLLVSGGVAFGIYSNHKSNNQAVISNPTNTINDTEICISGSANCDNNPSVSTNTNSTQNANKTPASTKSTTEPQTTQSVSTPVTTPTESPAQIQAYVDANTCKQSAGNWYNSLVNFDNANATDLINNDNQTLQAYDAGDWTTTEALNLINENVTSVDNNFTQDYNDYVDSITPYNCTAQATSALYAPQCTVITDCVSEVPTR